MDAYKHLLRPLLFRLDAERAHNLAKALLKRSLLGRLFGGEVRFVRDDRLTVAMGDLLLPNPVGLGAGFDKDGDMMNSLFAYGFGYVTAGSFMQDPRPGNPKPRLVRDPPREALYSCMGLPSRGLDYGVAQLRRRRGRVPLVVNINAEGLEDYFTTFEVLQPFGD
jgi:dihydroorotate dehydrogenase